MLSLTVQNHTETKILISSLEALVTRAIQQLSSYIDPAKSHLVLVFVRAKKMQDLNAMYRKKNYVTDVLSFSGTDQDDLGELVFCLDKLRSQASENGHSLETEFLYLLLHGVLHLCGYDHESSESEAEAMFAIQDKAFDALRDDVSSVFS